MIVKWSMSSRVGKRYTDEKTKKEFVVVRQSGPRSYFKQENKPIPDDWWRYFYYEVEPIEKTSPGS